MLKRIMILIFLVINFYSYSHPHVFWESSFKLNIQNNIIKSIDMTFYLDELNTLTFLEENKDKKINTTNLELFKNISQDFKIQYDSKNLSNKMILKNATVEDGALKIETEYPINKNVIIGKSLVFSIYDPEYFYTYDYEKYNLTLNLTNNNFSAKFSLKENKKKPFYFGMVFPKEYEVKFY